jgi:hypothetical protein
MSSTRDSGEPGDDALEQSATELEVSGTLIELKDGQN